MKLTMEVKLWLYFVLFACLWCVNGCDRHTTIINNCSGHATCHFHRTCREKRSSYKYKTGQHWSAEWSRTYSIMLRGDPCNFNTYDADGDGAIKKEELHAVLCINDETDALFSDLDAIADDGVIKTNEFIAMAPLIITDCFKSVKP